MSGPVSVSPAAVEAYLRQRVAADATLVSLRALGDDDTLGLKSYGYGRPLHVVWRATTADGVTQSHAVLHTMRPDPHGHDRRADRLAVLAEAAVDFGTLPRHVRAMDVGTFDGHGQLVSLPSGEPWLLTQYVSGQVYAHDLAHAAVCDVATEAERRRATTLADYLASVHLQPRGEQDYRRHVRDTIGSGEGIFGIVDSWPSDMSSDVAARLQRIERAAVGWRWRLRGLGARARRIHGDFHPFNIVFDDDGELVLLDSSRRASGEPADDVTCLALNYLFFALRARGALSGACRDLWMCFWQAYLVATGDHALLELVGPWFAWRSLVVASPLWYPELSDGVRMRLLSFAEEVLSLERFDPFAMAGP